MTERRSVRSPGRRLAPCAALGLAVLLLLPLTACSSDEGAGPHPGGAGSSTSTTVVDVRKIRVIPPTPAGQRPPQLVLVSFDGAGGRPLFEFWRQIGKQNDAHFTFFLSGVYLLDQKTKQNYLPPRKKPGTSDINYTPVPKGADPNDEIAALLDNLNGAWWDGNEIGSHFNGHFCGSNGVNLWKEADWTQEINEFNKLLTKVAEFNQLPPTAPKLKFGPQDILGARTPCLEGQKPALYAAEKAANYKYDASGTTRQFEWPKKNVFGLWDMAVAAVPVVGSKANNLLMDYNLYTVNSKAKPGPPEQYALWKQQARDSFQNALDASYTGNRSPVVIGNHFEEWNGRAYTDALADFLAANCKRPEIICASHEEVYHWLEALAPGALESFQAGSFPKTDVAGKELPAAPPPPPPGSATTAAPTSTATPKR